jgi:predicted lipoprotein with Yx(FWY)xxD motif
MVKTPLMLGVAVSALIPLAGCGGSSSSSSKSSSSSSAASGYAAGGSTTASTSSAPAASEGAAAPAVMITTKHAKLGTILAAGDKKMTVYLFEADKNGKATCSGACEGIWPPVTTSSTPQVGGAAMAADLGTISRANGTKQITYKGHPLYFYAKDKDNGDAYGQDIKSFGAGWYVLGANGAKIENHKGG